MNPNQNQNQTPGIDPDGITTTPAPKRKKGKKGLIIGFAGTLVLGIIIGGAGGSNAETADAKDATAPAPATATVTETAKAPKPKTIETKVEVTATECKNALRFAEEAFDHYSTGFNITAELLNAASTFDQPGIDRQTAKLNDLRDGKLEPTLVQYQISAAACRAADKPADKK